jgi:hypothetical protein
VVAVFHTGRWGAGVLAGWSVSVFGTEVRRKVVKGCLSLSSGTKNSSGGC